VIKKITLIVLLGITFYSCKKDEGAMPEGEMDNTAFTAYEGHLLDALWKLDPDWATASGYHKYDSVLVIPSSHNRQAYITFTKVQTDSLLRYNAGILSESNKVDYHLIQDQLETLQWQLQQEKAYEWNPCTYNIIGTFAIILNEHYAPLAKRLRSFYQKMADIPAYYKEAQKQIKNPVPELTDLAVEQLTGGIGVMENDFADSLKKTNIPAAEQKQMLERAQTSARLLRLKLLPAG